MTKKFWIGLEVNMENIFFQKKKPRARTNRFSVIMIRLPANCNEKKFDKKSENWNHTPTSYSIVFGNCQK